MEATEVAEATTVEATTVEATTEDTEGVDMTEAAGVTVVVEDMMMATVAEEEVTVAEAMVVEAEDIRRCSLL